jgi:hypothetical protein
MPTGAALSMRRRAPTWRRTGSYYLIAGAFGPLFAALSHFLPAAASWAAEDRLVAGFLLAYGMALAGGLPAALVTAFLLRRVAAALRARGAAAWLVLGTTIGVAVPWLFARTGYALEGTYFPAEWQSLKRALIFPFMGPMMYQAQPAAMRLAVAAAVALVLWAAARRLFLARR